MLQGIVYRAQVHPHNLLALPGVALARGLFDRLDCLLSRENAGDGEEAGLHDGVYLPGHAALPGYPVGVNHVEAEAFLDDFPLDVGEQTVPYFLGPVRRVEKERAPRQCGFQHIVPPQENRLVARYELSLTYKIGRANRFWSESQVRHCDGTRLLGVIHEIALSVVWRLLPDDLYRVLVGSHRTVRPQAVEDRPVHRIGLD
jgi:hypothetical protein